MPNAIPCICGKQLTAPASLAGKKAKCPACGAVVKVPGASNPFDFDAPGSMPVLTLATGGSTVPAVPSPATGTNTRVSGSATTLSAGGVRIDASPDQVELSLKTDGGVTLRLGYQPAKNPLPVLAAIPLDEFNNRLRAVAEQTIKMAAFQWQRKNLSAGSVIKNGWLDLILNKDGPDIRICAPNFSGDATQSTCTGMFTSLSIAVMQEAVHKACRVKQESFHWSQPVAVVKGALTTRELTLNRESSKEDGKCEWTITPKVDLNLPGTEILRIVQGYTWQVMPAYALLNPRHTLVALMNLPIGYSAEICDHDIKKITDPHQSNVWPGKPA